VFLASTRRGSVRGFLSCGMLKLLRGGRRKFVRKIELGYTWKFGTNGRLGGKIKQIHRQNLGRVNSTHQAV